MSSDNKLQAILWDMDGVLVDNKELHFETWVEIYRAYGDDGQLLRRDRFEPIFGMRNAETVAHLFGADRATPAFIERVSREKEALFRERLRGRLAPLPGVEAWLAYWQAAGVKQALASSAPQGNIDLILAELGLAAFFDAIVCGESAHITRSKPAPDVFLEAARQLAASPGNCLVIEDAVVGVEAAKAAGMRCLAVTTTHSRTELVGADRIVENLAEIPPDRVAAFWPTLS